MALDLDAYFRRIGYAGAAEPTLTTLQALQRLHPRAIAFAEAVDDLALDVMMPEVERRAATGARAAVVVLGLNYAAYEAEIYRGALKAVPRPQLEAARTLGASALRSFILVTLPLVRPGLVAGMLFAFIVSFDNVSLSLFLTNARTNTLPIAILNYVEYNFDPGVAAISATMVAVSLAIAWLVERLVGLRKVLG